MHPRDYKFKPIFDRVIPCSCRKEKMDKERQERYLRHCQLPEDAGNKNFNNFKVDDCTREAHQAALDLVNENGIKWLTLLGKVDMGKTHLLIAICKKWMENGKPARYAHVPLMLEELRKGYDLEGENAYHYKLDFFCKVSLLALDDLGVQKPTDWAMERLNTIIDYRYINGLPLIVTTNKSLDVIPGDDEHRIASRLRRANWCKVVAIEGPEYSSRSKKGQ